jgi:hypothetical protein
MLAMRPNCECCDRDLAPEAGGAMICTFECTFCEGCGGGHFGGVCPNCGGGLVLRPVRPERLLATHPGQAERVWKAHEGCVAQA